LPHLRPLIANQNRIVRIDGDPRIDFIRAIGVVVVPRLLQDSGGVGRAWGGANADHEAASGAGGGEDKVAPRETDVA
jgi:hypothetical protein